MDDRRFDNWSKALAARGTRRGALKKSAGAALLGALGIRSRARAQSTGLGDDGICRMEFEARVHSGPSAGDAFELIAGMLSFQVGDGGLIEDGELAIGTDRRYPVTGQATGRFLTLSLEIEGQTVIVVGAGETNVRTCAGQYGGPSSGPQPGDLGAWTASTDPEPASSALPAGSALPGIRAYQGDGNEETGLGDDGICRMEFETNIRFGPTLESQNSPTISGLLELEIGENGGIGEGKGALVLESGVRFPVVGQAPGQSIALRISVGERVIVAVGVGDSTTRFCDGLNIGGRTVGPTDGDLGDWVATAAAREASSASTSTEQSSSGGSGSGSGSGSSGGGSSTPPCTLTQNDCSDLYLDLDQCACICQNTGEPVCGERCCTGDADCINGTDCVCPNGNPYCEGHCLGCPAGSVCQDERCVCPALSYYCDSNNSCVPCQAGRTYDPNDCSCKSDCPGTIGAVCNGVCVDLAVDPANCGTCGTACASGQTCANGTCSCQPGWTLCGDTCRDLTTDRKNCGACFYQCGAFDSCIAGVCS